MAYQSDNRLLDFNHQSAEMKDERMWRKEHQKKIKVGFYSLNIA